MCKGQQLGEGGARRSNDVEDVQGAAMGVEVAEGNAVVETGGYWKEQQDYGGTPKAITEKESWEGGAHSCRSEGGVVQRGEQARVR